MPDTDDRDQPSAPRTGGPGAPAPRGLLCPQCAVRLVTTVTRTAAPGVVVRYVKCRRCRLTARTEERLVRIFEPDRE